MRMILKVLAILGTTLHTSQGSEAASKPISVIVLTTLDNTQAHQIEATVSEQTNVFFRYNQNEFNAWVMNRLSNDPIRPRKYRHMRLGRLLREMYPYLNLGDNVSFEVSAQGDDENIPFHISVGLGNKRKAATVALYDTTSLFIEAGPCRRYAMEYRYVQEKFPPNYDLESSFVDEFVKKNNDFHPKKDEENPSKFKSGEPHQLWQMMNLVRSLDDISVEWNEYLEKAKLPANYNLPAWLIQSDKNTVLQGFRQFYPSFSRKFHGANLATTGMIALTAGLYLKRIMNLLTDPSNSNVILTVQETMMRALVIALAGVSFYNDIPEFKYASVLILEKHTTGVKLLFASGVDELDENLRSSDGQERLIVEYHKVIQEFVSNIERSFIPKKWLDACETKLFQEIETVGGKIFSQGLENIYGYSEEQLIPKGELLTIGHHKHLWNAYNQRKKYCGKPNHGYPISYWINCENHAIFNSQSTENGTDSVFKNIDGQGSRSSKNLDGQGSHSSKNLDGQGSHSSKNLDGKGSRSSKNVDGRGSHRFYYR